MNAPLLDTNTIIRFVTNEPEDQAREVEALFSQARERNAKLVVLPMVLAEAVFVLCKGYRMPREKAATVLSQLIASPGFDVPERDRLLHALHLFGANKLDFVDSYLCAASILEGAVVVSFDRDYDKFHGVKRKRPKDLRI